MGTALDTGQKASGPPSIKLRNVGDSLNFAVVDIDLDLPVYKFGTQELDTTTAGKPKTAIRLTVIATGGNAVIKDGDADKPVEPGDIVSIFVDSYTKWDPDNDKVAGADDPVSWGKALDRLPGGLEVGTLGQYAYLRDIPSAKAGNNARRDRKFRLKAGDPSTELAQRCEAARIELKAEQTAPATQLAGTAPNLGEF